MTTMQILRAESGDIHILADLLGEASHTLAPAQWLVLNPIHRAVVLPAYMRIHLEHAMTFGQVHITTDRSAVAVWLPHDR
ncbi:MAG: N-acetyltransferase, partial [Micromonosporaceae bacterium]|nr:N-acetyltransferase [Micromonosporaceae bacterium]